MMACLFMTSAASGTRAFPSDLLSWNADAANLCVAVGSSDQTSAPKAKISHFLSVIHRSPAGQRLLVADKLTDTYVCATGQSDRDGDYEPRLNTVFIVLDQPEGEIVETMAHELRHAWQQDQGFMPTKPLAPRESLLLARAIEADAEAFATQIIWELKQSGYDAAFDVHAQSQRYGDIVAAFAQRAEDDRHTVADGRAARAAYDAWFANEYRTVAYDDLALRSMLYIARQPGRIKVSGGIVTSTYLTGLGDMLDGTNYLVGTGSLLTDHIYLERLWPTHAAFVKLLQSKTEIDSSAVP
jgi:hypothetical protein